MEHLRFMKHNNKNWQKMATAAKIPGMPNVMIFFQSNSFTFGLFNLWAIKQNPKVTTGGITITK